MCGGGGAGSTDSFTSSVAPWNKAAHKELIGWGQQEVATQPYKEYQDDRIAGFSDMETASQLARQEQFERGDPYGDYAADLAAAPGYESSAFDFGKFDNAAAEQYMSPYMDQVVAAEKRAALEEYERQGMRSDAERVSSGARGGYREAIEQALGGAQQGRVVSEIESRGRQSAFMDAQQQFERDRAAAISAARMGDASALNEAKFRLAQSGEVSQRETENLARSQQRIRDMEMAGATQREMNQAHMDLARDDFYRQENFAKNQMTWLSGLLGGVPGGMQTETRSPGPTLISQLAGAGIGAAGLAQLMKP